MTDEGHCLFTDDEQARLERVVAPFPRPGVLVTKAMQDLHLATLDPPYLDDDLTRVRQLPRPWDPGNCTGSVRNELYRWLDDVAHWINTQHLWGVNTPGVPECWPAHPHIVHDLATVACGRFYCSATTTPDELEDWHRHTLPLFLSRLHERLGESCPPGRHTDPPRRERNRRFASDPPRDTRQRAFARDLLTGRFDLRPPGSAPPIRIDLDP